MEISYTSVCRNNRLIILDALNKSEGQTGRRLHEDINDFSSSLGRNNYCTRYEIEDRAMLIAVMKMLETQCKAGVLFPALHFECHGDAEKGLKLAASGEYVSWLDLSTLIAPLNTATKNNIAVVLASCHGFSLKSAVNVKEPCPFNYLIAPSQEITAGALSDSILPFYKVLMETGELNQALKLLDNSFQQLISGEWFYKKIVIFFTINYTSKAKLEMVERIINNEVVRLGYQNRERIRAVRAIAKKRLANPQDLYESLEKNFFHGKASVPYANIKKIVTYQKSLL